MRTTKPRIITPTFFFFQAEDGIRDLYVTGVQTCALPIYHIKMEIGGTASAPSIAFSSTPPLTSEQVLLMLAAGELPRDELRDRKSTRLNSSHVEISYAVFCLKKKKNRYNAFRTRTKINQC